MNFVTGVGPIRAPRRPSASALDPGTARALHLGSVAIGCAMALMGLVFIGGWGLGIGPLRSMLPDMNGVKANTALGITALGAALALAGPGRRSIAAGAMAVLALAIGALTLAEYVSDRDFGIDEILFRDGATRLAAHPGRPAFATALIIALLAAAQLFGRRPALHVAKTTGALAASLIAWASITGYVFGSLALSEVPPFSSVALHTAVAMLLLAIGILAAHPISWPLRTALATGTGGTVCRWLLPAAFVAPPLLGWFLSHADAASSYPNAFRWALYSVASSLGSVSLILLLAHRISLIEAERTFATEMSLHDPLTGVANRRAFDAFLLESFGLAKRHKHPLSLAMLDIDHFKSYNDDFGHPAGDELLRVLGRLLTSMARETDLVARVGGEEFAIALPETGLAGASVIAERIRAEMEQSSLFRRTATVSIGVATMTSETTDTSMLVAACDEALYRAKAAGRNTVSLAGEPAAAGEPQAGRLMRP